MRETKQTATKMSYNEDAILEMDVASCARTRAAIEAGLEYAPTSISTEPGAKNPLNIYRI